MIRSTDPELPTFTRLRDLRPGMDPAAIVARVLTAERREVTRRGDGGKRPILSGLLGDGTAAVRFSWWDPPRDGVERGTILRATQVDIREYQGRLELVLGWRSRVEPGEEADLPEMGSSEFTRRSLREVVPGDQGFKLEVRVVRVRAKPVRVRQEWREIFEGLLADSSDLVAFTAWSNFSLTEGEAIRIRGGFVRTFRGGRQLSLDERCEIERIEGRELPSAEEISHPPARSIAAIEQAHGGELVELRGMVTAILNPSGVVHRCPECGRVATEGSCRVHGAVRPEPDLRARLALDDGTGTATIEMDRSLVESFFGLELRAMFDLERDQQEPSVAQGRLFEEAFGLRLKVQGAARLSEFGLTVWPQTIEREVSGNLPELVARCETRIGELTR